MPAASTVPPPLSRTDQAMVSGRPPSACSPLAAKASASPGSRETGEGSTVRDAGSPTRPPHAAKRKTDKKAKETVRSVRMGRTVGRKDSRTQAKREARNSWLGSLVARHILRHRRARVHPVARVGAGRLEGQQDVWITFLRIHVEIGLFRAQMAPKREAQLLAPARRSGA